MSLVFVNIPQTGGTTFEETFTGHLYNFNGTKGYLASVGHSWTYPTKIKGWLDWDNPSRPQGEYHDVNVFNLHQSQKIVTLVRNPFAILVDYFIENWAWCKRYHGYDEKTNRVVDFQAFVDDYLDDSKEFHAPAFKKSLFSQLKDKDGNWLTKNDSIIIRYEHLLKDFGIFSRMTDIPIQNITKLKQSVRDIRDWKSYYRKDQIEKLQELWIDDLDYLGYLDGATLSKRIEEVEENQKNTSTNRPKIALCFSGNIRDIDHTKDFWKKFIKENDVDVYASFWDIERPELGDTIDNFKRIYDVKEIEIEKYSNFKKSTLDTITQHISPPDSLLSNLRAYAKEFHTYSMWYKIWKCNMLSKSLDVDYDVVIRARTDSYLDETFHIVQNDMLNVPVGRVYTDNWKNSDGVNDIFGYGSPKIMDYYSSTFLNLLEYVNTGHYMIPPEHLLTVHMSKVNLNIRFFPHRLTVTRNSKGRDAEVYNKQANMVEEILPSNFVDTAPNEKITWTLPIRDSVKF